MNILFIGDIFGSPGRRALIALLPRLQQQYAIDFTLVNVDNSAGGKGITDKIADELFQLPIDVMTAGNHVWEQVSINAHLESHPILRPYNCEQKEIGKGSCIVKAKNGVSVAVVHLQGRAFMEGKGRKMISPFLAADEFLKSVPEGTKVLLVDFHAEATAEKRALGWYLDGRVSAMVGTHTHVQTADEEILPRGSAYITDMGMTGPHQSVIGLEVDVALRRFLSDGKVKDFEVGKEGVRLQGVVILVNEKTGRAQSIQRINEAL